MALANCKGHFLYCGSWHAEWKTQYVKRKKRLGITESRSFVTSEALRSTGIDWSVQSGVKIIIYTMNQLLEITCFGVSHVGTFKVAFNQA